MRRTVTCAAISLTLTTGIARGAQPGSQVRCATASARPATSDTTDLDRSAEDWAIYCEGVPTAEKRNVATPSTDGSSLELSLTGGVAYSSAHFYRTFRPEPDANAFTMTLTFMIPATSLNNKGFPSVVQALEFTMSKWQDDQRYEFALQWRNVGGKTAPEWRYWDPSLNGRDRWIALGLPAPLTSGEWHRLSLEGEIVEGQVHYTRFGLDDECHAIDRTASPARTAGEPDRLTMGVQLDGNALQSPYSVFVDAVAFVRSPGRSAPCSVPAGTTIDAMEEVGGWYAMKGNGAAAAALRTVDGCRGRAVALDYDIGHEPGAWAQLRKDFDPPIDLSRSDHVQLYYRGSGSNRLELGIITADGRIFFASPWSRAAGVPWCSRGTWDLRDLRSNGESPSDLTRVAAVFLSAANGPGEAGGSGFLVVDEIEGLTLATRRTAPCSEPAPPSPAAAFRAAGWIGARAVAGGLVKSWQEEPADFAWLYDQALALLVFTETEPERASALAARLAQLQNADGSWFTGYHYETGRPINGEQPIGAIAWTVSALAHHARTRGDRVALDSARAGAAWLAALQRRDGSLPARADELLVAEAPTETNLDAWWAFHLTGRTAEAARLRDFLLTRVWDDRMGRFKASADAYQIFLDNHTWGAAFLRAAGRERDANRALTYASATLAVVSADTPFGAVCGLDGAGPFAVWNEGTLQYAAQGGEDSQFLFDQVVAQQAPDGGVPGSPLAGEFAAGIVWLTPWHGVAPAAWLYFAGTGGPRFWRTSSVPSRAR